jgi:hypothetical protein
MPCHHVVDHDAAQIGCFGDGVRDDVAVRQHADGTLSAHGARGFDDDEATHIPLSHHASGGRELFVSADRHHVTLAKFMDVHLVDSTPKSRRLVFDSISRFHLDIFNTDNCASACPR